MEKAVRRIGVFTSGGDAPGMNAAIRAVVRTSLHMGIECVGIRRGYHGLINGDFTKLTFESVSDLSRRGGTMLYSARSEEFKTPAGQERAVATCKMLGLDALVGIGGDGTFSGLLCLAKRGLSVVGIPGTIDNDIACSSYTIGYDTACNTALESIDKLRDTMQSHERCSVVEVMGRHAGWLAGSAALAAWVGYGPDLIYLPEVDFDMERFLADVHQVYQAKNKCLIAVSEGIHRADGAFIAEGVSAAANDGFGHTQLGGLAALLADLLRQREPSAKVRGIELSLPQRCGAHSASQTDIDEAFLAGKAAVEAAVAGYSDKMVAFRCTREGGYRCETVLEPLDIVANAEKTVPRAWINADGNGLEQPFIDYVLPLIQGVPRAPQEHSLPRYARLKKVLVSQEA